ncbi:helix-turn-helix domain-containing protein [Lentzea sp. NPDC005914]|uniref:helix-turn-helix domain-containing protein n=1 Tax=Lentzea sp. NPDC005914 TaxID=3154572 RepID=UPI0033C64AD1
MLEERSVEVAPRLRPWIAGITTSSASAETIVRDEPDTATTLALRTAPGEKPELMVIGPRTRALYYRGTPGPSCAKVRLQPGAAKLLLGRSVRDLVDRVVPLRDIRREEPVGQRSDPAQFLEALIEDMSVGLSRNGDSVGKAADLLSTSDVQASAQRLHVSERHLRNVFVDSVGLSPKRFARIERVRSILAHGPTRPWSELAIEAGYYDHSHMTAEFRVIMGVPPTVFFSRGVTPTVECKGIYESVQLIQPS